MSKDPAVFTPPSEPISRERLIEWLRTYAESGDGVPAHRDIMRHAADAIASTRSETVRRKVPNVILGLGPQRNDDYAAPQGGAFAAPTDKVYDARAIELIVTRLRDKCRVVEYDQAPTLIDDALEACEIIEQLCATPSADEGREIPPDVREAIASGPYPLRQGGRAHASFWISAETPREFAARIANMMLISAPSAIKGRDDEHVAWCRYVYRGAGAPTIIELCDSDEKGAFKVYRHSPDRKAT